MVWIMYDKREEKYELGTVLVLWIDMSMLTMQKVWKTHKAYGTLL